MEGNRLLIESARFSDRATLFSSAQEYNCPPKNKCTTVFTARVIRIPGSKVVDLRELQRLGSLLVIPEMHKSGPS